MNITPVFALRLLATTKFELVTEADREAFAGIESEEAYIGTNDKYILIIDNNRFHVINYELGEAYYTLNEIYQSA